MNMLDYIKEQPVVFREVLTHRTEAVKPFVDLFCKVNPDRLYIIASGTSHNGSATAAPLMQEVLGMDVLVSPPSRISKLHGSNPLIIYVSQGGNSTNTIAAMDRFASYPSIAMTGEKIGRINELSKNYMEIPCGPETAGPKTKGYTITILTLYLMALEAAKASSLISEDTYAGYISVLEQAASNFADNVEQTIAWQSSNDAMLRDTKVTYLIGKNQCMTVAQEGGLKLQETMLIPTVAFDFEEFLHGPTSSLSGEVSGFYLLPPVGDPDRQRMLGLIEFHRSVCENVYVVGDESSEDVRDCVLKTTANWYTQPFESVLPMQVVSAIVPDELQIDDASSSIFHKLDVLLNIKFKGADGETEYGQ